MGFFSDLGNAVSSAASAVGDLAEDAVDVVVDTAEDVVDTVVDTLQDGIEAGAEWVCENDGEIGCAAGNFVGGLLDGAFQGFQDIANGLFDVVRDVAGIVGSVLRLDLPGLLHDLGTLVLDVLDLGIDAGRFMLGGYAVGGVVRYFRREALRRFVERLVNQRFGDNPAVRDEVRRRIGLGQGRFGFRLPSEHRVFVMDSATVPLWQMHEAEEIDLYAMAHLLSFDSFAIGASHPNTVVKSVDEDGSEFAVPVTRWTISRYLSSKGKERRLRVYAMSRQTVARKLDAASRKCKEIAVMPQWNDGERFAWFRDYTRQEVSRSEYDFNTLGIEALLAQPAFGRPTGVNCNLRALAAFKLDNFGRVAGRDIAECDAFPTDCATPGRTDRCCITVRADRSSGVIYRDVYPSDTLQYILPHEMGHYLGLCHCGHDGFQHVMFTSRSLGFLDWGLVSYYWESEPHFTLGDGKNAWRFIVDQLTSCLTQALAVPLRPIKQPITTTLESCGVPRELPPDIAPR